MNHICVNYGEGKYAIVGTAVLCGEDINLSFIGGTKPHIGAVSLAVYEPQRDSATVSTVAVYTHRDGELSAKGAKETARTFKCTVTAAVGIHIDHVMPQELDILIQNFEQCLKKMMDKISTAYGKQKVVEKWDYLTN